MDPNAALAEIRQLLRYPKPHQERDRARLEELILALDAWLSRGGFLPRAWEGGVKQ